MHRGGRCYVVFVNSGVRGELLEWGEGNNWTGSVFGFSIKSEPKIRSASQHFYKSTRMILQHRLVCFGVIDSELTYGLGLDEALENTSPLTVAQQKV